MNMLLICYVLLFFMIILLKENWQLIKKHKQDRECYIKTLNHDLRVATLAQIRALDLLYKTCSIEQRDLVKDINESCKYSLDMISCLLNTYKFDNNEQVLKYSVFNLTDLLSNVIDNIRCLYLLKDFEFRICSNENNYIEADRDMLFKLLTILLVTAITNSTKQSLNVLIEKNQENCIITLSYEGNPISEEEYRRMFLNKPSYTTVGNGIRMYFCKKIIDFHCGKINVFCDKSSNKFTFTLPLRKPLKSSKILMLNFKKQTVCQ